MSGLFGQIDKRRVAGPPSQESYELWKEDMAKLNGSRDRVDDNKVHYKKKLEVSLISTLLIIMLSFQVSRMVKLESETVSKVDIVITAEDIPLTEQLHQPPPPPKPSVPIPTESEDIPEDLTIETTELSFDDVPPPPPPPSDDAETIFIAYDEPPQIIGGMAALQQHLAYPDIARKAGVECMVIAKVLVAKEGVTRNVEILKTTVTGMDFEESAIAALNKIKWKPAKQRDQAISTWVSVPIQFRLVE